MAFDSAHLVRMDGWLEVAGILGQTTSISSCVTHERCDLYLIPSPRFHRPHTLLGTRMRFLGYLLPVGVELQEYMGLR